VRVKQVDAIGLQAAQRLLGGGADVVGGQPLAVVLGAHLGREDDRIARAAPGHPAPDDLLALAAAVAGHPLRIAVSGVDEVAAGGAVGVQHREGLRLVGRPAEDVRAQAERVNSDVGPRDVAHASNLLGAQTQQVPDFRPV
jgi:hypothetical protein